MTPQDPAIVGQTLWRTFGQGASEAVAVADVSIRVSHGEVVLLMGPSGSGKSTLLALMAGLLRPTRGEVLALGRDLWQMSEQERERFRGRSCGFIFQGYNLFASLTVREQLELVLRWLDPSTPAVEVSRRVGESLEALGLGHRADALPGELSGGEKQRVAICRALLNNPALCFADEPTSALDWAHGEQVVRLLVAAARRRGTTVVIVTHDSRLIPFGDRVIGMKDGRLEVPVGGMNPKPPS